MLLDSGIAIFDLAKIFYLRGVTEYNVLCNKFFVMFGTVTTITLVNH
jgi:hypothetical protein